MDTYRKEPLRMGKMIFTSEKCKNPKKKPGWQEAAAQEAEWLKSIQGVKLFSNPGRKYKGGVKVGARISPIVDGTIPIIQPKVGHSLGSFTGFSGGKKVPRPEIQYKDDPVMLARELKARERKFATAPAYNKGGAVLITDEMMLDIQKGLTRRR